MANEDQKTVILEVTFSERRPAQPVLDQLLAAGLSSATVLRGRVTASDAWFQLELRGTIPAVDAAVRGYRNSSIGLTHDWSTLARVSLRHKATLSPIAGGPASPPAAPPLRRREACLR